MKHPWHRCHPELACRGWPAAQPWQAGKQGRVQRSKIPAPAGKYLNGSAPPCESLTGEVRFGWKGIWFRDVDSNHDTQLQRLMSYRLDDPGTAPTSLTEPRKPPKNFATPP